MLIQTCNYPEISSGRLLLNNCWNNPEIHGVYTTHYSVRVEFGPSRVRVGQKILSTSRVSSTRRFLIFRHSHKIAGLNNGVREDKSLLRTNNFNCLTEIATIHVGCKDCIKSLTSENGSNSLQQLNGWEMVQGRGGVQQKNTLRQCEEILEDSTNGRIGFGGMEGNAGLHCSQYHPWIHSSYLSVFQQIPFCPCTIVKYSASGHLAIEWRLFKSTSSTKYTQSDKAATLPPLHVWLQCSSK